MECDDVMEHGAVRAVSYFKSPKHLYVTATVFMLECIAHVSINGRRLPNIERGCGGLMGATNPITVATPSVYSRDGYTCWCDNVWVGVVSYSTPESPMRRNSLS